MELTIESELLNKLKNTFSFAFKVKSYSELGCEDVHEIYSFLLSLYDASWIVPNEENKAVKQINM